MSNPDIEGKKRPWGGPLFYVSIQIIFGHVTGAENFPIVWVPFYDASLVGAHCREGVNSPLIVDDDYGPVAVFGDQKLVQGKPAYRDRKYIRIGLNFPGRHDKLDYRIHKPPCQA